MFSGDAGLGHYLDFLVNEANAAVETVATVAHAQRRAVEQHPPGVGLVYPGDDFEQGALASAVFAD